MVGPMQQRQCERRDRRQNSAQREVLEYMEAAVVAREIFGEGQQHG